MQGEMSEDIEELVGAATREELLNCIQLLALSIVQHREKRGFVSFRNSMEQLRSDGGGEADLFMQGKELLEEAIEMARIITAELAAASESEASEDEVSYDEASQERRAQPRINITKPIKLMWQGDSVPVDAQLEDISWGGASINVEQVKIDDGDAVQIILPDTSGGSISIEAKVLRTWELPDRKEHGVALRFSSLSTRDEAELEKILQHLVQLGDSGGQRQHARLTPQLNIQFDGIHEFEATLNDISAGGLGITVPDPLRIGQSLQAVISTLDESYSLKLRARVVRQDSQKFGHVEVYHAGLKFEHPSKELYELTRELLRSMATLRDESSG
jgi:c-di-GMP-binding flagellar brake protein YcgR